MKHTHLIFIQHLQAERADWLQIYAGAFAEGAGSLDRDQLYAVSDVLEEVQNSGKQRIDIATDFVTVMGKEALLDITGEPARQAAAQLVTRLGEKFGVHIATNAAAGLLSSALVGLTVGDLLYGLDPLFANFTLARRADELRATFYAGRSALHDKVTAERQQTPNAAVYNGDLAAQFRVAYLLETLAAVQTQRAYADGVAATFALPNPVQLINWLRGEDWKQAVAEAHQMADQTEKDVLNQLAEPVWLKTAIVLALSRTIKGPIVIADTPQEPGFPKLHPEWTSYTNSNFVYDLLVQGDIVWAATSGGVVRWDTRTNSYVKLTTEYGLANNHTLTLLQSADGAIWFGTWDSGVSRLDTDGHWTTFNTEHGLGNNTVLTLLQSTDGALWFGTYGGVSHLDVDGRWTTFTTENGLINNVIRSIMQSTDGALWFGTDGGASRLDTDGRWTSFTTENGLAVDRVAALLQSADGAIWFGTWDSGVSRLDANGHWTTFTTADGLAGNDVPALLESADGILWFGGQGGVSRLDTNGRWTTFTTVDGLAGNYVPALLKSADGILWFGGQGGVSRLDTNGRWTTFATENGLGENSVPALLQSADGALWFGTERGGVSRLDTNGGWTTFTTADITQQFQMRKS